MKLDVFQQKNLFVPYKTGEHKSLFVVIGLKNLLKHNGKVGSGDQPGIYHFEPCPCLDYLHKAHICDVARRIRDLMNTLWRNERCGELDKIMNPFSARLLPLWQPRSEYIKIRCVKLYIVHMSPNIASVSLSTKPADTGIAMIQCVASLIGLSCNYISKVDIEVHCLKISEGTSGGSQLHQLRSDIGLLMMSLSKKYMSTRVNNSPNDTITLDPFSPNIECDVDGSSRSNGSEESSELLDSDNDSIWQPSYNDNSVKDDDEQNLDCMYNDRCQDINSKLASTSTTSPSSGENSTMLEKTNHLFCPGDVIKYRMRTLVTKVKSSTIVTITDDKSILLDDGTLLKPKLYDIRRVSLYCGGGGGQLLNPFSEWFKLEESILHTGTVNPVVSDNSNGESSQEEPGQSG